MILISVIVIVIAIVILIVIISKGNFLEYVHFFSRVNYGQFWNTDVCSVMNCFSFEVQM
jgi:hypothetical protein